MWKPQSSITFKVVGIGVLALLMLIPLAQVQGLVAERHALREHVIDDIAQGWGNAQDIGGPVLAIPRRERVHVNDGWVTHEVTEIVLADRLVIDATLTPNERRRGIYSVPVYEAELHLSGRFLGRDVQALAPLASSAPGETGEGYLLDRAELRLPVADPRGLHRIGDLQLDGDGHAFTPAQGAVGGMPAIAVPLDLRNWHADDTHAFALDMRIAGTASLRFLPLARHTEAAAHAPWANPSFNGSFLPAEHKVGAQGFEARWQVLDLNRAFAQRWIEDLHQVRVDMAAFGVALYQPADLYQRNERAGKYGVLFVALTFVAFFLFEVLRRLRVHPVQYLLVGLALTTFYLVLLALSEQIGFDLAYLAAALAVVALVGGYATAVLRARRAGLVLGATLGFVYALLYGLVVSEDYSLLMGALALLAVVAALMFLTRKVDWYTYAAVPSAPATSP